MNDNFEFAGAGVELSDAELALVTGGSFLSKAWRSVKKAAKVVGEVVGVITAVGAAITFLGGSNEPKHDPYGNVIDPGEPQPLPPNA